MLIIKTLLCLWNSSILIYIEWCVCIIEALPLERVQIDNIRQEMSINEQYDFYTPRVDVNCACRGKQNFDCGNTCNIDHNHRTSPDEICIHKNDSAHASCCINIRPASQGNSYTAYRINHSNQQVFFSITYSKENIQTKIEHIPLGISQVKTFDGTILKLDTTNIKLDALNAFTWLYGELSSNNIKCGAYINDVNEKDLSKLGWYRKNVANGKYDVDKKAVTNSLVIDAINCPTGTVEWKLNAVHYYNYHGLLKSHLPAKTISEATGGTVENVIIDSKAKTMSIEYRKNAYNIHFQPVHASESFNFSAYVTFDTYSNKLIHVTVYEAQPAQVNVEIGIPGTTRSLVTFYHEEPNQIHHHRISASVIGPQWVCAYPTNLFRRNTCVMAIYQILSSPIRAININSTYYNFGNVSAKPPTPNDKSRDQLKKSGADGTINTNVVLIPVGIIVAVITLGFFVHWCKRRDSCCQSYQNL